MQNQVATIEWWVQLLDSSPLENHDDLRTACRWFEGAGRSRYDWSESSSVPTAIMAQGNGPPPDVYKFLEGIQHLIGRNEYMIFVMMVESDTLDQNGIYHIIVTQNTLTKAETGRELLAKAKAMILDVDEDLSA